MKWVDACHGIGGFRLGFEKAGWPPPVAAFDVQERLVQFYNDRFGGGSRVADIFDVSENPAWIKEKQVDLVVCGAPCQPFSHANANRQKQRKPTWETSDPRIYIPFAACELAAKLQADFVVENVLGILDFWGGEYFSQFLTFCEAHGYHVGWTYMDCAVVGVPSRRKHVLIFGARTEVAGGSGPVLELFTRGIGEEHALLLEQRETSCLPFRVISQRHTLGFGQYVVCEIFEPGDDSFRLRSFGLREVEFLLGFPERYTEGLPHTLADQALADAFPPPAAKFLGRAMSFGPKV